MTSKPPATETQDDVQTFPAEWKTCVQATNEFLEAATWLSAIDAPAVAVLQRLAKQIDDGAVAAVVSQYGLTYRALLARSPEIEKANKSALEGILGTPLFES